MLSSTLITTNTRGIFSPNLSKVKLVCAVPVTLRSLKTTSACHCTVDVTPWIVMSPIILKVDDEISFNEIKLGKILISDKYPFGLIKFKDESFDFNKTLNCGSASIKILKPQWLK